MLSRSSTSLLATISGLVLGLAGIMCGMVGDNWFCSESDKAYFGLLRLCQETMGKIHCSDRKAFSFSTGNIWGFEFKEKILDDIFTMLLMSSIFALLGLVVSISMSYCCTKNKNHWRFLAFLNFLFISVSASLSLAAAGISESFILQTIRPFHYTQDWTSTITWVGAAFLGISTVTSVAVFCFAPHDEAPKRTYLETFARATIEDVHFNFILDKPYGPRDRAQYLASGRNGDYNGTIMNHALNMLPLEITSFDAAMYRRMDEQMMTPPRYSPTPSEYSLPPSYYDVVGQSSS